ncbi:DUF6615 family protein [Streptomyces yaizuensis]|uniref:Zinc ribbon domain-containing protein n=1 Tax=Streptomyces yaizuensis TaxID=2989713 RepID=A0ABQ5NZI1_9ACTN|nr:DUF6615 family protein [Streptomyces sp. YSPA8]GLF95573.1 zinc ribbon domain-containing protein [Streptomyces sp. YSPA8]
MSKDDRFCPACGFRLQSSRTTGQPSSDLCRTLCRCAERTYERLAESHLVGQAIGEDSFTDFNLQDVRRAHGDRVLTRRFTREQEARNGADWEWWFHDGTRGFGIRVQAKKAYRDGRYVLHHVIGKTGALQSDRLIEAASASDCLPFYVFYSHRSWTPSHPDRAPADCEHTRADQRQLGCTIASALVVQGVLATGQRRSNDHVRDHSIPWNRLLCGSPPADKGSTRLETAHARILDLHWNGVDDLHRAMTAPPPTEAPDLHPQKDRKASRRPAEPDEPVGLLKRASPRPRHVNLDTPVYWNFNAMTDRPLQPLPTRITQMIRTEKVATAPDPYAAGAILVDLSEE